MVSKHFHFKKVLEPAHETLLCAVFLKPGCLERKNVGPGHQLLNLFVLKIKLSFVRKGVAFRAGVRNGKAVVLSGVSAPVLVC